MIKRETVIDDLTACDVRPCKKTKTKANSAADDDANRNAEKLVPKAKQNKGKDIKILSPVTSESQKNGVSKADKSKNLVFVVKMKGSYVYRHCMCLPKDSVTEYITEGHSNVTLQDSNGRVWSVTCLVYGSYAMFSAGWKAFAQANNLALGDACAFELVNSAEKLFKVIISRAE